GEELSGNEAVVRESNGNLSQDYVDVDATRTRWRIDRHTLPPLLLAGLAVRREQHVEPVTRRRSRRQCDTDTPRARSVCCDSGPGSRDINTVANGNGCGCNHTSDAHEANRNSGLAGRNLRRVKSFLQDPDNDVGSRSD